MSTATLIPPASEKQANESASIPAKSGTKLPVTTEARIERSLEPTADKIVVAAPAEGIEPFTPLHMKEWVRTCPLIPADQTCGQVSELFRQRRDLECIVIADERQKPRGLVMKHRFFRSLSSRFGIALYEDKPIALLMDAEPLIVDQDVLPQELIDKAMSRSEEKLYDTVIVTNGGRLAGILTISDLLNVSRLLQREAAERQIKTVRGAESMIVHVHEAVGKVAEAVNGSRASSERIAEIAGYGQQALAEMLVLFRLWHDTASLQEERMSELQQHTNEAVGITRIIFELADRCNLLAVNAQIEAARAGEHGKGFAVVAEEVRALADQTKQQADRINRQLTGMSQAVEQAAGAVMEGKKGADQGVRGVGNAEKTFSRLWEISSDNLDAAAKLTDASGEAAAVSDQIRAQVAKLASQLNGSIR